ncbi:MAG: hypothetical protein IPK76_05315 [Lewinellaceae bacterium]|nr:hypothetical protein [Lewinellaceae bacterium]
MEKEAWKDRIMGSLEGAKRAEPGTHLYDGIRARLKAANPAAQMHVVRRPYLALAAAFLALLLTANIRALAQRYPEVSVPPDTSIYQLNAANFDLY